jgi:hypothetical protein
MWEVSYVILQEPDGKVVFVEMPATHAYQLSALLLRLHKETVKLTADNVPGLPQPLAECRQLETLGDAEKPVGGLDYVSRLEEAFAAVRETSYPLVSLLTEIRALKVQLEQWMEEAGSA